MNTRALLAAGDRIGLPDPDASPPVDVPDWPGADRRWPGIGHPARLTLRPLSLALARAVREDVAPGGRHQSVLDVGSGCKPYLPYFAAVADEYIGLDVEDGPHVDVVGPAERLPFADERFDVVVSTQMLEHVQEPGEVLGEIHRVLRPGGVLLLSTHGTAAYHPCPTDLWRWTQEGLVKLVRDNGDWSDVRLEAAGGTAACFGYLFGFYLGNALGARPLLPLRVAVLAVVNVVFGALDRVVPLRYPRRYTLISNFLLVARKGDV